MVSGQHTTLSKGIGALEEELDEISLFKMSLKNEINSEKKMISDIQAIVLKYKKLLTQKSREKEKLS